MSILEKVREASLKQQWPDGYWWYTLEANESISAGAIQLGHFLGNGAAHDERPIASHILSRQRTDGSWGLYYDGPPDLSTTLESYFALKLAGEDPQSEPMQSARQVVLAHGGLESARVFTKIHLALFGIGSWDACPAMPAQLIRAPGWFPFNIYNFSSWARASIVPLLIVMARRPRAARGCPPDWLKELCTKGSGVFSSNTAVTNDVAEKRLPTPFSWSGIFLALDRLLKAIQLPPPNGSIGACETWVREHIAATEDIWPAMFYSIVALKSLGHPDDDPIVRKSIRGLSSFQHEYRGDDIPALPRPDLFDSAQDRPAPESKIHQQCCISPVWDTPWMGSALLESGMAPDHPALLSAARWLIAKQITGRKGDWAVKRPRAEPGGWSFEFENEFFPDVDDTIQVLLFLNRVGLPDGEKREAIRRGLNWILAMQSKNGGWGAFDADNTQKLVNQIPFADHGACLDEPSADLTGRMLELWGALGRDPHDPSIQRGLRFLSRNQHPDGPWEGRWGVNYIYGTWAVLQGLAAIGTDMREDWVRRAVAWLQSVQHDDGGWGESPEGYLRKKFVGWHRSVPSQTAWGVMGLIAAGESFSPAVRRGLEFLIERCRDDGTWEEREHTGTGFPGHFYIRYHGYRHYFPLMALAKARRTGIKIPGL